MQLQLKHIPPVWSDSSSLSAFGIVVFAGFDDNLGLRARTVLFDGVASGHGAEGSYCSVTVEDFVASISYTPLLETTM